MSEKVYCLYTHENVEFLNGPSLCLTLCPATWVEKLLVIIPADSNSLKYGLSKKSYFIKHKSVLKSSSACAKYIQEVCVLVAVSHVNVITGKRGYKYYVHINHQLFYNYILPATGEFLTYTNILLA